MYDFLLNHIEIAYLILGLFYVFAVCPLLGRELRSVGYWTSLGYGIFITVSLAVNVILIYVIIDTSIELMRNWV